MDVQESWARIIDWCHQHTPETARAIRPPPDAALLWRAEAATGGAWPEDLRAWYALADGTQRTPAGYVLPGYCPLPLQSVVSHWSTWQEIWADIAQWARDQEALRHRYRRPGDDPPEDPYDIARLQAQPAGTVAGMFLPSFVPIAEDQSGADLFVDTRAGPLRGCVTEFVKGDADHWGPWWPSVTAMLADIAAGLRARRPVGGRPPRVRPVVDRGRLDWGVVI